MSREERKKFEGLHSPYNKYWIPCVWFTNLAAVARCEGRIKDDHTLKLLLEVQHDTRNNRDKIIERKVKLKLRPERVCLFVCEQELNAFRGKCSMLFHYDMISVPLVYTQVSADLHTPSNVFHLILLSCPGPVQFDFDCIFYS